MTFVVRNVNIVQCFHVLLKTNLHYICPENSQDLLKINVVSLRFTDLNIEHYTKYNGCPDITKSLLRAFGIGSFFFSALNIFLVKLLRTKIVQLSHGVIE